MMFFMRIIDGFLMLIMMLLIFGFCVVLASIDDPRYVDFVSCRTSEVEFILVLPSQNGFEICCMRHIQQDLARSPISNECVSHLCP